MTIQAQFGKVQFCPSASEESAMAARLYDVVVLGASGFTGIQVCLHIARSYPTLRWAIAGRSRARLQASVTAQRSCT
jgi:hypothetical protein